MSVFLTPGGEPFYGGTYFPDEPRYGMPSFTQLLLQISSLWDDATRRGTRRRLQPRRGAAPSSIRRDGLRAWVAVR